MEFSKDKRTLGPWHYPPDVFRGTYSGLAPWEAGEERLGGRAPEGHLATTPSTP